MIKDLKKIRRLIVKFDCMYDGMPDFPHDEIAVLLREVNEGIDYILGFDMEEFEISERDGDVEYASNFNSGD